MKIIITGGAGFIGSNLANILSNKHDVHVIDNLSFGYKENLILDRIKFYSVDVRSPDISDIMVGTDIVFHFAGISSLPICQSQPMLAYDTNVSSVAHILDCARQANVGRIIFASTSAIYENNTILPFKEIDAVYPDLIYASTKLAAEHVCKIFASTYDSDIIIARFANVYGIHQDSARVSPPITSYLVQSLIKQETPILFNNARATARDYVYISDVVDLLCRMMLHPNKYSAAIYNVSSGKGHSVPELVHILSEISGTDIMPVYKEPDQFWDKYPSLFSSKYPMRRDRIIQEVYKTTVISNEKAQRDFCWQPTTTIEKGLKEILDYEYTHYTVCR